MIYWVFPIPNQMEMWPQFRSPLLWDVFAVGTYFTVSLLFWYTGMIPDLATLRDRAKGKLQQVAYGLFALGWRGSNRHWHRYERAYLLLAALSTPLVLSVHSVVSFDFAVSQLPGWHTTIFPPYFVAGAIFSGFAMVVTLAVPAREMFGLKNLITLRHLDNMNKIILVTGSMVGYAYSMEFFIAWYSGFPIREVRIPEPRLRPVLVGVFHHGELQRHHPAALLVQGDPDQHPPDVHSEPGGKCRDVVRAIRDHRLLSCERLPANFVGNVSFQLGWTSGPCLAPSDCFFTLFLLFCRFLPMIAMAEIKAVMPAADPHHDPEHHHGAASETGGAS